jgi:hypothetical protein
MITHDSTFYNHRDAQSPLPLIQCCKERMTEDAKCLEIANGDVSAEERPIHELPKCGHKTDVLRSWSAN